MLNIKKITKQYEHTREIRGIKDISFSVAAGEVVCILGPSGSGKSTLLRALAGLVPLDEGSIINPPGLISYVSQEYTLWPHLTVLENVTLAPLLKLKEDAVEIKQRAMSLLDRFGLGSYAGNFPEELSGGQRQRVALLRAVMVKPQVLLLDEVTSSLDPELTRGVLDLIKALAQDGYTMLIVTHHISFAQSLADRVLFLKQGRLIQDQSSEQFFNQQMDKEVSSFIADISKRDEMVILSK